MFGLLKYCKFMCFDWYVYIIDEWLLPYFFNRWLCVVVYWSIVCFLLNRCNFCDLVHWFLIYIYHIYDTVDSISLYKPCIWDLLLLLCHEWPWFCLLILHRYKFIYMIVNFGLNDKLSLTCFFTFETNSLCYCYFIQFDTSRSVHLVFVKQWLCMQYLVFFGLF